MFWCPSLPTLSELMFPVVKASVARYNAWVNRKQDQKCIKMIPYVRVTYDVFVCTFPSILGVYVVFSSVQSLSRVWLFTTPWIAARQASLSIANSRSSLRFMSIELVMPFSHLVLCQRLLLPPIPPSIRVFSNESTLLMRWPKYWSFSFSIISSKEHPGLISFRMDWLDLLAIPGTLSYV